jgi:hypothetical protein
MDELDENLRALHSLQERFNAMLERAKADAVNRDELIIQQANC